MTRARRRLVAAALVVAVLGASAGCGLPGSSPVQPGLGVAPPLLPPVRFQFEAPPRGAGPEQIVRGFLAASWASDDDFRAARAYLSPAASKAWDPRARVTVYATSAALSLKVVSVGSDAAELTLTAAEEADLDASGRYSSRPSGATRTSSIRLARTSGEWRVSRLDPDFGLWLSRYYFERAYRSFQVAYIDTARTEMVLDHRWFPVGAGLATTLARAQVESIPAYLVGAVRSGFPGGTRLAVDSVPVTAGEAIIDLSPLVLNVTAEDRRAAWAQMVTTLLQVPEVLSVMLEVGGSPLDVGTTSPPTSAESLGFARLSAPSGEPLRRVGDRFSLLDPPDTTKGNTTNVAELPRIDPAWTNVALSPDVAEVAGVDGAHALLRRWRGSHSYQYPPFGAQLVTPAFDSRAMLWVAGRGGQGRSRVWTIDTTNDSIQTPPRQVSAPWLAGREVLEVRPAPDAQRVLVISRDAKGGLQIGVSGVVRDARGQPVSLTAPWSVGGDVVEATRGTWVDDATLAVIGRRSTDQPLRPLVVDVGGATDALATVPDPRSIVSTGGERGIVVVSGDGSAYGRVGGGWQAIGRYTDVVVPGG